MNITVLCKIVDNFGDIGVVYRLVKRIKSIAPENKLHLIVDDLSVFNKICPLVNPERSFQTVNGIDVYKWNENNLCYEEFRKKDGENMEIILECFQCGRPEWMEKILFEDKLSRTVNIIMIDYLTAEDYAEDFHCLKSLTRSAKVQKVNFMPGFTAKTGGLIIDSLWAEKCAWNKNGNLLFFCYDRNWSPAAKAINRCKKDGFIGEDLKVLVAQGKGKETILSAFRSEDSCVKAEELPYLTQEEWDLVTRRCAVLFIRGEESMSRACLSGIPFVWHAYPQSDEYQLVKMKALLGQMKKYFTAAAYEIIERVWFDFNNPEEEVNPEDFENHIYGFVKNAEILQPGYEAFAEDLRKNGDLAENLMTFIKKNYII